MPNARDFDPKLDLAFERTVPVPVERMWVAWTTPELLLPWFTPAPWTTVSCEIDLRPGGKFSSVMRSPEGQEFPNVGCYLEIMPMARLVWTNLLQPGYRPRALSADGSCDGFGFVVRRAPDAFAGNAHGAETQTVHFKFAADFELA